MAEVIVLTSTKDSGGIVVVDAASGTSACPAFKNCIADPGNICFAGSSASSYSGSGTGGDYIISSQSKKTVINIWQWTKPHVQWQCHTQEIISAVSVDHHGLHLVGGSKRGWVYVWDISTGELLRSWQAHFKAITRVVFDALNCFFVTSAEDGMIRVWELAAVLEYPEVGATVAKKKALTPVSSWNYHSLAVKDTIVLGSNSTLRVVSCSLDHTLVMQDVHAGKHCLRISLPSALESVACSTNEDMLFAGSTFGAIYMIDVSVTAISVSAAHAHIASADDRLKGKISSSSWTSANTGSASKFFTFEGHTKVVTALACLEDGITLVSASDDGTVRFWHIWTRQCLKEIKPFAGVGITNAKVIRKPELLGIQTTKPFLHPLEHLAKYTVDENKFADNRGLALGNHLIGSTKAKRLFSSVFTSNEIYQRKEKVDNDHEEFISLTGVGEPDVADVAEGSYSTTTVGISSNVINKSKSKKKSIASSNSGNLLF